MIGRKDDPAFLYFPDNYRWSMGLLICLSGALNAYNRNDPSPDRLVDCAANLEARRLNY